MRNADIQISTWRVALALALGLLLTSLAWQGSVWAEDAPPPPSQPTVLESLFLPLKEGLQKSNLPPFVRDTNLTVHFRI